MYIYKHTHTCGQQQNIEFPFIKYGLNTFQDEKVQTLYNVILASIRGVVLLLDAKLVNVKYCFDDI